MAETIRAMLKRHEGLKLVPYKCSENHHTIGYGHNLDASPMYGYIQIYFDQNGEITSDMASLQLDEDIEGAISDCLKIWPNWIDFHENVKRVTIDLVFNMGKARVQKGFPNMVKAIAEEDYKKAAEELKYTNPGAMQVKYTAYWLQVKDRAKENFDLLMGVK